MLREELELDISQALARVDQLENALRAAVTGPLPIGVTVNDQALTSLRQQLAASDLDVNVDIEGEEAFQRLTNRLDEATDEAGRLVNEVEDVVRPAQRASDQFEEVADNLNRAEIQAGELGNEMLQGATSADRLESSVRELQRSLGLSENEARQVRDALAQIERIDNMDEEVRRLTTQLGLSEDEADKLRRSLKAVDDEANRGGISNFSDNLKRLATFATAALVIRQVTRAIGDAIGAFAEFDDALTGSLAITANVTEELRGEFIDVAREVANETRFGAEQAAEAFFFLASAGLDAAQQIEALPQVAQFAQAGLFDLALATDLLTDAQSALGLTVPDASQNLANLTRISDVLVKANTLANASVQQFSEALTNRAAAAARIVGVEVEEVTAVLAAFADQGRKGAAAGEAVNIVFRDLQRAASNAPEEFERLGIAVFDAAGELRPIADIIEDLENALAGLSDQQIRATITTLGFQDRSVSNLLTLLGTSDAIREYEAALRQASGTTGEIADNQLQSLQAALDIAGNQFDIFKARAGEAIEPAAREFADAVPEIISGLESLIPFLETAAQGVADFFDQFSRETVQAEGEGTSFATGISKVSAGLGTAKDAVFAFGDVVSAVFSAATFDLEGFNGQLDDLNDRADRTEARDVIVGINRELDRGVDKVNALADGIAFFTSRGSIGDGDLEAFFDQIVNSVQATDEEVRQLTNALIVNASANGFTASEVAFLTEKNRELNGQINFGLDQMGLAGVALEDIQGGATGAAEGFEEMGGEVEGTGGAIADNVINLETFNEELAKTDQSTNEFIATLGEQRGELEAFLDPVDAAAIRLQALRESIGEAAGALRNELAESASDTIDIFSGVPDQIEQSTEEILANIIEQTTLQAEFEANLARIGAAGGEQLANSLREKGPAAAQAAADFANDITSALSAESQLEEAAGTAADKIGNALGVQLGAQDLTPEVAQFLLSIAESFESESIQEAILGVIDEQFTGIGEASRDKLEDERRIAAFENLGSTLVGDAVGGLRAQRGVLTQGINEVFGEIPGLIDPAALNPGASTLVQNFDDELIDLLSEIDPTDETEDILELIERVLRQARFDGVEDAMDDLGDGLVRGIENQEGKVRSAGGRLADVVEQAVKEGLEISSPSKVMVRIGEQVAGDFANTIETEFDRDFQIEPDFTFINDLEGVEFDPVLLPVETDLIEDDLTLDPLSVQVNAELAPGTEDNLRIDDLTVTANQFDASNLVLAADRAASLDTGSALASGDSVVAGDGQIVINLEGLETKDLDTALAKSTQAAVAVSSQLRRFN